jgi:Mrp family chromosome partitioning ATPase
MILKNQKYSVKLTIEERKEIEKSAHSKTSKPLTKQHAKALLCLDENGAKPLTVEQTAKKVKLHSENIYKIRKQFCVEGMDRALNRKKRETPPVPAKVTGEVEAHIIAVACSKAPKGKTAWTLQMIANKIVLDGVIDSLGREAVRRTLKKHNINLT